MADLLDLEILIIVCRPTRLKIIDYSYSNQNIKLICKNIKTSYIKIFMANIYVVNLTSFVNKQFLPQYCK